MALVSLILVNIVIILIVLGALMFIGTIFLIIGIVSRRKPKNKGKNAPTVCIAIGAAMMFLPVSTAVVLTINTAVSAISEGAQRITYDSITDEWRNGYITDNKAAKQAIKALLDSADEGDHETFKKLFTPNIYNSSSFQTALDEFFGNYPTGLSECELDGGQVASSGSFNYGHNVQTGNTYYTCMLDGEWYYIGLRFCYENTDSPEDVGVTFFCIENLEANALDENYSEYTHLICNIKDESEVTARLIDGRGYIFKPTPDRHITVDEMRELLSQYDDLDDIEDLIGSPNVYKKYPNHTGYNHYYELMPENGEPRYVELVTSLGGEIWNAYLCSDTKTLYDSHMFTRE